MCVTHGSQWFMWGGWLYDTHNRHQSVVHTGPQGVGFRTHVCFKIGPQRFMWGGWVDATHILHQPEFPTGPQGVGFRQHKTLSTVVHVGWVAG